MRRRWIFLLLAAAAGAQEFSEAELDRAIGDLAADRPQAAGRIAKWGPAAARAVPALVSALERERLREGAEAALLAIGPKAVPGLAKAVKGKVPSERAEVVLARFAHAPIVPRIDPRDEERFLALFGEAEHVVRCAAARAVATRGPEVVPKLVPMLGHESPRRRQAAAFALAYVDPPPQETSGELAAAMRDKDWSVRAAAVLALSRLRPPAGSPAALLVAAEDQDPRVVETLVSALAARGKEVIPALLDAWEANDARAAAATDALLRFDDAVVLQVVEAMKSDSVRRKRFGAVYLGRMAAQRDLPLAQTLAPLLSDPAPQVRLAAAEALGIALPAVAQRALDPLLRAASDEDAIIRATALAAASRAAGEDPRVRAAIDAAAADSAPTVKVTVSILATADAARLGSALENGSLPIPARILAAERLRALPAGFAPALPLLAKVVQDPTQPTELRVASAHAIRILLPRRIFEGRVVERQPPEVREAVDRALRWLAGAQQKDGRWATQAWNDYDLGVTGLALLAFLAAGHTHREVTGSEPYAANVREGIKFIVSAQRDGLIMHGPTKQHLLVEHAIATQALCEAVAMTGDRGRREAAQLAVIACEMSRCPELAWGYVPLDKKNDTHTTAWMAGTLAVADAAGFAVDPAAFEGVRKWIDKMTDPNYGRVGYDYPGGQPSRAVGKNDEDFPARLTCSMTAAGVWCRIVLGEEPRASEMVKKGADQCCEAVPSFAKPGAVDFYYWYYGTLACFQVGGKHGSNWERELKSAVLPRQKPDGSWDPEDAWGFAGGRVYSTAMLTLALLTPGRFERGWGRGLPEPYAEATAALRIAAKCDSPRVRAAALGEQPK